MKGWRDGYCWRPTERRARSLERQSAFCISRRAKVTRRAARLPEQSPSPRPHPHTDVLFQSRRDSHKLSWLSVSWLNLHLSSYTLPARTTTTGVLCTCPGDPGYLIKSQYPSSSVPFSCLLPHSSIPGRAAVECSFSSLSCTLNLHQAVVAVLHVCRYRRPAS
jgi:hypothetical protein